MTSVGSIDLKQVGQRVGEQREAKGWRQEDLAERARISRRTVQAVESAEYRANDSTYALLALALDIPIEDLLGREN